jgi:tyrosine-protein phosphatase YwqE
MGVKLQLNLFSLEGLYGNSVKKWAEEILSNNLYDIAASDIHNSRQVDFFSTLKKNSKLSQYFDTIQNSILCSK